MSPFDVIISLRRAPGFIDVPSLFRIDPRYNLSNLGGIGLSMIVLVAFFILFIFSDLSEFAAKTIGMVGSFRISIRASTPPKSDLP